MKHGYPPRPDPIPDNAIAKACIQLRSVYEKAIDDIDGGQIVMVDGRDVSKAVRRQSLAEIEMVDKVIGRSDKMSRDVMARGATLHAELTEVLTDASASEQPGTVKADDMPLPEIGTYERR